MNIRKKDNIICLAIIVAGLLAALVILYFRTTVPYWQCSEVYKRYHKVEGVRATYIKNFPVNDTLTVGVTLLEATDSAGWERLMEDFKVSDELRKVAEAATDKNKVWTRTVLKGHPEEKASGGALAEGEWKYDMVALDFTLRMIAIFDINNMDEYIAIHGYGYDYMTNKTNQFIKK